MSRLWFALLALSTVACSPTEEDEATDSGLFLVQERGDRIFEVRQPFDGDGAPIASNNYFCATCLTDADAAAAFDAHQFSSGHVKSQTRRMDAARGSLHRPANSRGAPTEIDLIDAIDGKELTLGAQPQHGEILDGAVVVVMESTRGLEWHSGDVVHELSDGEHSYVMFARSEAAPPPDQIEPPAGWSYSSRTLDAALVLEPVVHVVVFTQIGDSHLWQRVAPYDEGG